MTVLWILQQHRPTVVSFDQPQAVDYLHRLTLYCISWQNVGHSCCSCCVYYRTTRIRGWRIARSSWSNRCSGISRSSWK